MNTPSSSPWLVYIVRCRDGSLYTGITVNLAKRLDDHNRGRGGKYTASRCPVEPVYSEPHPDRSSALKRESQIKSWPKAKKENIINTRLMKASHLGKGLWP